MNPRLPAVGLLSLLISMASLPAPPKGFNYEEDKVPEYQLPDPLQPEGSQVEKITSADEWEAKGRPATLALLEKHVYGTRPQFEGVVGFKEIESGPSADGKAVRRQFEMVFGSGENAAVVNVLLHTPIGKANAPYPLFLGLNFNGNHTTQPDPEVVLTKSWMRESRGRGKGNQARDEDRGSSSSRWPVEQIVSKGFAVATIYCGDIAPDNAERWLQGVARVFPETETASPAFSTIGLWAWGLSQARENLGELEFIDDKSVFVIGHSRLGKTSLWAGASDPHFAGAISNNSGCGGAALSRRAFGETVKRINTSFPHWFNAKYKTYNDRENECPVDQHQLIALLAPRPVYVASATGDQWADPTGEHLSLKEAAPVYRLFEIPVPEVGPASGQIVGDGVARAHLREGPHDITPWDWERYLDWAESAR